MSNNTELLQQLLQKVDSLERGQQQSHQQTTQYKTPEQRLDALEQDVKNLRKELYQGLQQADTRAKNAAHSAMMYAKYGSD